MQLIAKNAKRDQPVGGNFYNLIRIRKLRRDKKE